MEYSIIPILRRLLFSTRQTQTNPMLADPFKVQRYSPSVRFHSTIATKLPQTTICQLKFCQQISSLKQGMLESSTIIQMTSQPIHQQEIQQSATSLLSITKTLDLAVGSVGFHSKAKINCRQTNKAQARVLNYRTIMPCHVQRKFKI